MPRSKDKVVVYFRFNGHRLTASGYDCREGYISHIVSGHVDKVHVNIEDDDDRFYSNLFIHIADPDALVEGA